MADSSVRDRLLPWLERWSVIDARAAESSFPSLTLRCFEEEAYLVEFEIDGDELLRASRAAAARWRSARRRQQLRER